MDLIGPNQNVAFHDRQDAFPDFMEKYTKAGNDHDAFPINNDAASELTLNLLESRFTDWTRPGYYEPVNEPGWQFWSDDRFTELHTSLLQKVKAAGIPVEIGGPCYAVGYHYKQKYGNLGQITGFIDRTNFSLDFYSYHIYDYLLWDDDKFDFTGRVSSGLPSEGVFDAIANHTVNKFGEAFTYVTSEHGGYIYDSENRDYAQDKLADLYFPGSGFEHTMEKRSISDHLAVSSELASTFTFMNNPHIVKKAVPFILLESFGWDARYYASLLVANNFNDNKNWVESGRVHFYEFFKDVNGRRILSFCDDNDIQHHAFVDDNKLILIFNNQSNVAGTIKLDIKQVPGQIKDIKARRYGRLPDFRPFLTEERLFQADSLEIKEREAIALFIEYDSPISQEEILNEMVHYGDQTGVQFSGSKDFTIEMPQFDEAEYAILRVGIGLSGTASKNVNLSINGTLLESPVEDCADRLSDSDYGSTRMVRIDPSLLQAVNTVNVSFLDGQSGGVGATVIRAAYSSSDTLNDFDFNSYELTLFPHQEDSLSVNFFPETTTERTLNWSSLDESIATVSPEGVIRGMAVGSTAVIGISPDGLLSDTCAVIVKSQNLFSKADKSEWVVVWVDDEGTIGGTFKELAIDDDLSTYWHTEWQEDTLEELPHEIWVDMGDTLSFDHFIYTPRQDQWGPNATIGDYELYFSNDTANWGALAHSGSFNWGDTSEPYYYKKIQDLVLPSEITARFFRMVALSEHQDKPEITTTAAAELDIGSIATGLVLREDSLSLSMGESFTLDVLALPLLGTMDADEFRWYSDNNSVASVESGNIRGSAPGDCYIFVEMFDGSGKDSCQVEVSVAMYEVEIIVQDLLTDELLPGADVSFNSREKQTDDDGSVIYEDLLAGSYSYSVSLANFESVSGSLDVQKGDPIFTISLERTHADLAFSVSDSEGTIEGASILISGAEGITDTVGLYTYSSLIIGRGYNYTVSKEGYGDERGSLKLKTNTKVDVVLSSSTAVSPQSLKDMEIYPVPVHELLYLSLPSEGILGIYSMDGVILEKRSLTPGDHSIDMTGYESGIYLFKFNTTNGEHVRLIPVVH